MTFTHDGVDFDLDITYADVTGVEWEWSGRHNEDGEPLMGSKLRGETVLHGPLLALPDLYLLHGPLIPTPQKATADMYRRVLMAVTS